MKRITLHGILLSAALFVYGHAQAQLVNEYAHWSTEIKIGTSKNQFGPILGASGFGLAVSANVERTFNPLWGLAADYTLLNYPHAGIRGNAHEFTGLTKINVSNILAKYRTGGWQKLSTYIHVGAGFSFYDAKESGATIVLPIGAAIEYNISSLLAISFTGDRRWHSSSTMGLGQTVEPRATIWTASVGLRFKWGKKVHIRNTSLESYDD